MKTGIELIAAERQRQIEVKKFSSAHDDEHTDGSIAQAATCYASTAALQSETKGKMLPKCFIHKDWPWERGWWRPSDEPIDNLVKAGALIAAEIDRLNRQNVEQSRQSPDEKRSNAEVSRGDGSATPKTEKS